MEEGSGELAFVTFGDVDGSTADTKDKSVSVDGAVLVLGNVWICFFRADTVGLNGDVLEGVGWQATLATVVVEGSGTVNELLLRE